MNVRKMCEKPDDADAQMQKPSQGSQLASMASGCPRFYDTLKSFLFRGGGLVQEAASAGGTWVRA